jgi:serine/threonine protein phosphatase PrpC
MTIQSAKNLIRFSKNYYSITSSAKNTPFIKNSKSTNIFQKKQFLNTQSIFNKNDRLPILKKKIYNHIETDPYNNKPLFNIPSFGKTFPNLPTEKYNKIKSLECKVMEGENKIALELLKAKTAAEEQHLRFRKIAQEESPKEEGWIWKIFEFLFPEPPKKQFESISVTEKTKSAILPNLEVFDDNHIVVASSPGLNNYMEDTNTVAEFSINISGVTKRVTMTGIFDGHGGNECSNFVANNIASELKKCLEQFNEKELSDEGIYNAITMTFVDLSHQFNPTNRIEGAGFNLYAGNTANIALNIDGDLWVANSGDSRAVLVDNKGIIQQLSEDAKPFDSYYYQMITDRYGYVSLDDGIPRINRRLAVGTSLGDHWANGAVSSRPRITKLPKNDNKLILIQCTDGIFDVATNDELVSRYRSGIEKGLSHSEIAQDILLAAVECQSRDNLTVLIRSLSHEGGSVS